MAQKDLTRMAIVHSNQLTVDSYSSIVVTGPSGSVSGHPKENLLYQDPTRLYKSTSYSSAAVDIEFNFGSAVAVSSLAIMKHNLRSSGHSSCTITSSGSVYEGALLLPEGDYDFATVFTAPEAVTQVTLDFGTGTSDGLFIGNIILGLYTELGQNPTNGRARGREDTILHQEVDEGGSRHTTWGISEQQNYELEFKRGLETDLQTFRDIPAGELIFAIPPLEHAASPYTIYGHQFSGYKKSVSWASINTYGNPVRRSNFVVSLMGT